MGESSLASSAAERLLWRLWVAPERARPATGSAPEASPPRGAPPSTWGGGRERKLRRPVRVVEGS